MSEGEEEGDWFEEAVGSSSDPADDGEPDVPDEDWEDSWGEAADDRTTDSETDAVDPHEGSVEPGVDETDNAGVDETDNAERGEADDTQADDTDDDIDADGDADSDGDVDSDGDADSDGDGRTDAGGFGGLGDGAPDDPDDAAAVDSENPDSGDSGDGSAAETDTPDVDAGGFADVGSEGSPGADDGDDSDANLFEDDFAAALSDTDVPTPDSGAGGGGGGVGDDFSMTGGSGGGMDPSGGAFDMGTDDLGSLDGLGGDEGFDADEEDLDSEIDRIKLGVEGLDAMIQGGIPERTLMVAIGSPGTGKTTLGLHFLEEGLEQGEKAVYITLEETRERVIRSATEKNMPFDEYHEEGQLAVIDIDPVEMANSLQTIRSELPRLIDEFGASRLVLDSVSLLEMMYEDRATRRNEIYDFTKSLKASGVTTLMTSEASEDSAYTSRHRIVEYLTDAVFILQYVRPSDFRETRLAIEIQKIRDAHHSRETKPYEITNEGMSVYRQANIF